MSNFRETLILHLVDKLMEYSDKNYCQNPTYLLFRINPVKLVDEMLKGNAPIEIDSYLGSKADSGATSN
jgi:hypothetical protein